MDINNIWEQTIQNVSKLYTDDKEAMLVKMIGSQVKVSLSGNIVSFSFSSQYASTLFPDYLSAFFKELKKLTGIKGLSIAMQPVGQPEIAQNTQSGQSSTRADLKKNENQPISLMNNYYDAGNISVNGKKVEQTYVNPAIYSSLQTVPPINSFQTGIAVPTAQIQKGLNRGAGYMQAAQTEQSAKPVLPKFMRDEHINPTKTFDNYVTDPENELIVAIAKQIAAEPGSPSFNPFYIYGGSGLGKTHLLFAIANQIKKTHPEKTVLYTRAEEFIHNYVQSMSTRNSYDPQQINFQELFTSQDVFIVDDIQNFIKGEKARDTFFEIIASFIEKPDSQLILASDVPPGYLKGFNQRLTSRFGSGVCREIVPPSSETRTAIAISKCREFHVELDDEIIQYIATHIRSNVREIEGAIKTLKSHIMAYHEITYDEAVRTLNSLVNTTNQTTTVDSVKERVAQEFKVTVAEMESALRKKNISNARSLAMTLANTLIPSLSLNDLGRAFNKDHSSVHQAIKRTRARIASDPEYANLFQNLINSLKKE